MTADTVKDLREVLTNILRCEYDGEGLFDCIDNTGKHYPSAYLADQIKRAEEVLARASSPDQAEGEADWRVELGRLSQIAIGDGAVATGRAINDLLDRVLAVKPAGWFNPWNDTHGFQQVAKGCEGEEGTVPLFYGPALTTPLRAREGDVLVPLAHATSEQITDAQRRIKGVMLDGQEMPTELMLQAAYTGFLKAAPALSDKPVQSGDAFAAALAQTDAAIGLSKRLSARVAELEAALSAQTVESVSDDEPLSPELEAIRLDTQAKISIAMMGIYPTRKYRVTIKREPTPPAHDGGGK